MKINGANILNANNYRAISIHKNINVFGCSSNNGIMTSKPLTKTLKGKSEEYKIEEIIRYFLRNHTIAMLYEDKNEVSLISTDNVELIISRNHLLSKELIREIKEKFYIDRMQTYDKSDVDFYWITSNSYATSQELSYGVGTLKDIIWMTKKFPTVLKDKKLMEINVGRQFKITDEGYVSIPMNNRNKEFLDRILSDIEDVYFYTNVSNEPLCIYKCKKDGKDIYLVIDKEVWRFINSLNDKIECDKEEKIKCKKLQYRMEEF